MIKRVPFFETTLFQSISIYSLTNLKKQCFSLYNFSDGNTIRIICKNINAFLSLLVTIHLNSLLVAFGISFTSISVAKTLVSKLNGELVLPSKFPHSYSFLEQLLMMILLLEDRQTMVLVVPCTLTILAPIF